MGNLFMSKGRLTLETVIVLVLVLIFLFTTIPLFAKMTSPVFRLGVQEQSCRFMLRLAQVIPGYSYSCPTLVIPFTQRTIQKESRSGEQESEAGARLILEYMQRCKDIIAGPKRAGYLSSTNCYICYSLHTSKDTPLSITSQLITTYALSQQAPNGVSYYYNFKKDGHALLLSLDDRIKRNTEYGIVYVGKTESGAWAWAAGGGAAYVVGLVVPNKVVGGVLSLGGKALALKSVYEALSVVEEEGALLLTDYATLEQQGCTNVYTY